MTLIRLISARLGRFAKDTAGAMTAFALTTVVSCLMVGAYAIDYSYLNAVETRMQATADAAAHAAILTRAIDTEANARTRAISVAELNMPVATNGSVLRAADVEFGTWNAQTRTFTPSPGSSSAVRVTVRRTVATQNPLRTFLLRLAGTENLDVVRQAIMIGYNQQCLTEGFVAQGMVDIQSNNTFRNGFCIHSNTLFKVSSGNFFEPGVRVSMPNLSLLQQPNSGFGSNPGLQEALMVDRYDIRILSRIGQIITGLQTPGSRFIPSYITNQTPRVLTNRNISAADLTPGRIHTIQCSGNQSLNIANNAVITNVVIVTNCPISFGSGSSMENAVIATSNTGTKAISGPSGIRLGRNDGCAAGGGAQVISAGGIDFSSSLQVFGAQLLAGGNIGFSASASGVQGVAMVAGGTVSGTSGVNMSYCEGRGMEQNYTSVYARLVR